MSDVIDPRDQRDIQALVATGFTSMRQCRYLFLRVVDPALARIWIADRLNEGAVKSVADIGSAAKAKNAESVDEGALTLAFTYAGLTALGLLEDGNLPFPALFKAGMANAGRAPLFDDDPAHWTWRDVPGNTSGEVHLLAAYFFAEKGEVADCLTETALNRSGLVCVISPVHSCPSYIEKDGTKTYEPFGFRDGISQPVIKGLRASKRIDKALEDAGPFAQDNVVAPGEFLLGHVNEYGETAICPDAAGWPGPGNKWPERFGRNGSYVVVRQYRQDVDAFWKRAPHSAAPHDAGDGDANKGAEIHSLHPLGEKMLGRTLGGAPLGQCPYRGREPDEASVQSVFRHRVEDGAGFQCPRGAHIRRANPRDLLGWDVESGVAASKLHRLVRRGRAWTEACKGSQGLACGEPEHRNPKTAEHRCGAGIVFIALNADLERQYEFIQQQWLMNRKFGDLLDEQDPILGNNRGGGAARRFSIPASPAGKSLTDLEDFTTVLGGGYFFLPGIAALKFIANGPHPEEQPGAATISPAGAS
jgi:putative iron-dependent peroxidase